MTSSFASPDNPHMPELQNTDYIRQLSIDCVIFGYREGKLHVLLPKLATLKDYFGLPGGFVRQTEDIDEAARRVLSDRTGLTDIYLEQFRVFGKARRSNDALVKRLLEAEPEVPGAGEWISANREWLTSRFVSIGYYALVDISKVTPKKTEIDVSVEWYPVANLPPMILDHAVIAGEALKSLRRDLDEKLIAFNLLPEKFTMKELRLLYEAVYDRPFRRNNFQKKMLDLGVLERLEKKFTGASNRAPYLYRFGRDTPVPRGD